jgi:hypothetical protein
MMRDAGEKEGAELRRRLEHMAEESRREKEALQRRVDEALAAKEATKIEMARQVTRTCRSGVQDMSQRRACAALLRVVMSAPCVTARWGGRLARRLTLVALVVAVDALR